MGPEKCNDFYARNIVTGKYLKYNGFRVRITSKEEVEGGGFINRGLINLICSEPAVEGGEGKKLDRGKLIPKDPNTSPIIKFSEELYELYALTDVEELTEDSFLIVRVDEETIMNIQYILSAHEHLTKFLNSFISHMIKERERNDSKTSGLQSESVIPAESEEKHSKIPAPSFDFLSLSVDELENIRNVLEMLAGKIYGTTYS